MTAPEYELKLLESLRLLIPEAWQPLEQENFPFADYTYLSSLEETGCVGAEAGWLPLYLTLWEKEKLVGATCLYLKSHSYGEYIFDWQWANAYASHGVSYYPKLVSAVPFTPATGNKLLLAPDANKREAAKLLIQSALGLTKKLKCHSLHYLFIPEEETQFLEAQGLKVRHSFQYHWKNPGYQDFGDFIKSMKTKKGKQILREREQLQLEGVQIETITGKDLKEEHATLMYQFYLTTLDKWTAIPYLNEAFFKRLFDKFRNQTLFFLAKKEGKPLAGSVCYFKGKNLYGRYWGALEQVRNLHFELCYYRPIEFAVERKFSVFEAGAQGEHKIQRGFLPVLTYSAHHIEEPRFRAAIEDFIGREKEAISETIKDLSPHSPFR